MSERPLKVLRVITRLNVGGPARQIDSLVDHLDPTKFQHIVVTGSVQEGEVEHPIAGRTDFDLRRISGLGRSVNVLSDVKAFFRLVRLIRAERPDIVHTHLAKAGFLGRTAAWLTRVPVRVHTFHGHLLNGYFSGVKLKTYVSVERALSRITTYNVCVGERVRQDLISARIIAPDSSRALTPGIEAPRSLPRNLARQELEIDGAAFVILFVGRLVEIKRVDRFVEAINEMGNEFPSVLALIVGDGPEYDRVLPLIENAARFRFVGWQEDLGPYYAAADMVCLTSDNEGMPIALIEAALCGLPAVTTDAGSAREVVKHQETGLVVPMDNFPKLLEAIRMMITDAPFRDGLGFRAKEFAEHAFSGARLARDHAEIYEMLVTRRS